MRPRILFTIVAVCGLAASIARAQMLPVGLKVDEHSSATTTSDVNKVVAPGELVLFEPAWQNSGATTVTSEHGTFTTFTGPVGATYSAEYSTGVYADYGNVASSATANCYDATAAHACYQISVIAIGARPVQHWDASFSELLTSGETKTWPVHIGDSFTDVPSSLAFYRFIETIFHKGITAGCGGTNYCPTSSITRQQIAVFLMLAEHGAGYAPPPCTTPVFTDVPCSSGFAPWINQLVAESVTAGCGGGNYCPTLAVTRAQMAVFLLRTKDGPTYTPPACVTPTFPDVPCSSGFAIWVNELAARGITGGCGGGNYCPNNLVTRGQMSVFLTTTFAMTLYGP